MRSIDADELKEAINTSDKFACLPDTRLVPFYDMPPYAEKDYVPYVRLEDIVKAIDNAQTVEQEVYMNGKDYNLYLEGYKQGKKDFERPQAKWIEKEETPASVSYYCSNCKMEGVPVTPFCPWCGAEMHEEEE